MPAVQLIRLRTQIQDLLVHFSEPGVLQRKLRELLELYADHTFRPGQASIHQTTLASYLPAPLVMRELEIAFARLGRQSSGAALRVVSTLRRDPALEPRLLGARLLGSVDPLPLQPLLEEVRTWCTPEEERRVLDEVLDRGCARLRNEAEPAWRELLLGWSNHPDPAYRMVEVRAILPAVRDEQFINLPPLLTLLSPLVLHPTAELLGDLQETLAALIQRSPAEAAFFLRQMVNLTESIYTLRLARRLLPLLPPDKQENLRGALRLRRETSAS